MVSFLKVKSWVGTAFGDMPSDGHTIVIADNQENRKAGMTLNMGGCPSCGRTTINAAANDVRWAVWPRMPANRRVDVSVPAALRKDYTEACLVLPASTNASAALARRCLQTMLTLQGAKDKDLFKQVAEVEHSLPSQVSEFIDKIRELGNLAAHAKASHSTSEIIDVDPHEAEWLLALLEELFDHYYVKPATSRAKAQAVEAKLASLGKVKK